MLIVLVKIGIYRNAQDPVVRESFSPKVKSMVDVWHHGKEYSYVCVCVCF